MLSARESGEEKTREGRVDKVVDAVLAVMIFLIALRVPCVFHQPVPGPRPSHHRHVSARIVHRRRRAPHHPHTIGCLLPLLIVLLRRLALHGYSHSPGVILVGIIAYSISTSGNGGGTRSRTDDGRFVTIMIRNYLPLL